MTADREQTRRDAERTLYEHRSGNFPLNGMQSARTILALLAELEQAEQANTALSENVRDLGERLAQAERERDEHWKNEQWFQRKLYDAEARLAKVPALVEDVATALIERCCNACGQLPEQWGPVCPGVTQGDFTHFHSSSWWTQKLVAVWEQE